MLSEKTDLTLRRLVCTLGSTCISTRPVLDFDPSSVEPLTHYIVVRSDLPIGVLAAQLVHAAGESSSGDLKEGTHAVVLSVPSEMKLESVAARLDKAGLRFKRIVEPDMPWNGSLMALGIVPGSRQELRRHLSDLPLFRGSTILPESSK